MTLAWATKIAALLLALAPADAAQPPALPTLPASLAESSALSDAAAVLRSELDSIAALPADPVRDARIALRRVAFDLLFRGASAHAAEQAIPVAGLRLFALRETIDAELAAPRAEGPTTTEFRSALARFAAAGSHGIPVSTTASDTEAALTAVLRPLEEAIAAVESRPPSIPSTAWPALSAPGGATGTTEAFPGDLPTGPPASWSKESLAAAIERWSAGVAAVHAPSKRQFEAASKAWTGSLRDPRRAKATGESMLAFDAELRAFEQGPFERRLRRLDPAARDACAGRADDLLRDVDRRRAEWARGWADGRGSVEASKAMLRCARTLAALDAISSSAGEASVERRLGAWGGFSPPDEGWRIHPKALAARSVIAIEALVAREDAAVDRELELLDRDLPLVMLADGLARSLEPWLSGRKGIGPRLVAVRDAPAPGSFLGARRAELMLLSRALLEEQRARARKDAKASDELRRIASSVAGELVPQLSTGSADGRSLRSVGAAIDERAASQRPAKAR